MKMIILLAVVCACMVFFVGCSGSNTLGRAYFQDTTTTSDETGTVSGGDTDSTTTEPVTETSSSESSDSTDDTDTDTETTSTTVPPSLSMCGSQGVGGVAAPTYDNSSQSCCVSSDGVGFVQDGAGLECCGDNTLVFYNSSTQSCCVDYIARGYVSNESDDQCCGLKRFGSSDEVVFYNPDSTNPDMYVGCCIYQEEGYWNGSANAWVNISAGAGYKQGGSCCGTSPHQLTLEIHQICCDNSDGSWARRGTNGEDACCAQSINNATPYNTSTSICCDNLVYSRPLDAGVDACCMDADCSGSLHCNVTNHGCVR